MSPSNMHRLAPEMNMNASTRNPKPPRIGRRGSLCMDGMKSFQTSLRSFRTKDGFESDEDYPSSDEEESTHAEKSGDLRSEMQKVLAPGGDDAESEDESLLGDDSSDDDEDDDYNQEEMEQAAADSEDESVFQEESEDEESNSEEERKLIQTFQLTRIS